MVIRLLLVTGAIFVALTALIIGSGVNAVQVGTGKIDTVLLSCNRGTVHPRVHRIVAESRSVGAGAPSSESKNCSHVIAELLADGFIQTFVRGASSNFDFVFLREGTR